MTVSFEYFAYSEWDLRNQTKVCKVSMKFLNSSYICDDTNVTFLAKMQHFLDMPTTLFLTTNTCCCIYLPAFTCSKETLETPEECVKTVQS